MADTLQWTRLIYGISKSHGVIRTWSCVQGVCVCREACSLARISCHVGQVPKWCLKGTGKLFSGFLRFVEVSHDLDHLHVLYWDVCVDCNLLLRRNHVWSRHSGSHRLCILFINCSAIHPTCSHTFYTCSTLYLLKIFGKFFTCLVINCVISLSAIHVLRRNRQCDISYACPESWYILLMFDTCPELVINTLTPCAVTIATVFTCTFSGID